MEWHEDLKLCLMQAGVDDKSVVFLFNDTQVRVGLVCFVGFLQAHAYEGTECSLIFALNAG